MRKLKLFSLFLCLFVGLGQMWGAETVYKTALFGSSYNSKGVSSYTGVSFSSTNDGFTVDVVNANNNNNAWSVIKIGGKNGAYTGTITTNAAIDKAITKVDLTIDAITAKNVTSITLKTSSDGTSWSDAGTFTKETGTKTVTLSSPTSNLYYKIEAVCTKGSSNGLLTISKVEYYAEESGPSNPTVSLNPDDKLNFATVGVGDEAPEAQSFTITGSHMTAALSIADLTNFDYSVTSGSLSPSEGSISATVTVTPKSGFTASAGDKSEMLKISGDDLDAEIELALNAEVKAKHNIIFDTDLKSIANVSVMEGEIYDITETIEAALIASCTYTKFEGWTTATSIADPSVKPSLVSSVTMSTADVTLKPVFSKTEGGSGSSEVTITPSSITGTGSPAGDPYTIGHNQSAYTILANKNNGSTAPTWNSTAKDIRVYAKGTVVISNSSAMSRIVFNLSDQGKKRLAPISASAGTIATQASSDETVVWTGNETSVTFTVGNNAEYGSDGSSKAGQLCFSTITATTGGGGTTTYSLDPGCAAPGQCYAPTFSPSAGTFDVAQNVELASTTDGATIRYTIDGSTPSKTVGTVYSSAIPVSANTTIKAIAYKEGMTDSEISEGVFNIRCAQPTFSLEEGEYTTAQNVTISAAGADAVYYTINGDDPIVDPANLYDGSAIAINTTGSHTIKAMAVKEGYANSNVASATYVMDLPYGSIAEFIDGAPTAAAKDLVFEAEDNCVITGINGTTIYIQDASGKGIMIFGLSPLPTNAAVNHQITGTINAKYTSFKGQHEMTNVDFSGASISEDPVSRPTPAAVTGIDATNFNEHTMVLVSIENLYYKSSSDKTHKFATTEGGSTEYTIYDQFGIMSGKTMPETSVACNLTGILSVFNTTYQLLPVFATDIVADADAAAPTVSPVGGADAENAVTAAAVEITAAAGTKVDGQASKTVDINFAIPTEVTVEVTRDFYRSVNYSCGWYKAAAAKYNINGQGATTEGTVVAKVAGVEAATAAEGDEVHVFITPNAHFHLATILVNDGAIATTKVSEGAEYSFEMPGGAVTIAVTWTEDAKATLNFAKGDANGEEAAPGNIVDYIGETIQLPANPFTYTGHKFAGWSCDGGTTKLAAGANYVLAEDKAFVAQWDEIPTFDNSGYEWQLVTSNAQLVAGKYYVIGSASAGKTANKTITSGYLGTVASTIADGAIAYNALGENTAIFKLGGKSGAWTLVEAIEEKQLTGATTANLVWDGVTNTTWPISIDGENAIIGASDGYRVLYNVNSPRFKPYDSKTSASMVLPQLYVWAEKVYKLRYDANGGENAPAAQAADGEGKATVTDAKPTKEDYIFKEWNTLIGGDGEAKAAGDVIDLSEGDVTLYAQWRTPENVTVSYDANGGEGTMEADADQVEGSTYTIKTNIFERNGYLFVGWKAYDANDVELTITNGNFIVPATNVTVKAQWSAWTATDFVLVTDKAQLKDGDKVYIVAAEYERAMGTQNTNYRNEVAIQKAGSSIKIMEGAEPVELTLGKDGDNFTFNDGTGYLYAAGTATSKENYMNTKADADAACNWTITIDENGTEIKSIENDKTPFMQYNPGSTRFSCYSTASQQAVVLYKKENAEPDYETVRSGLEVNRYYTVCLPKKVTAIKGASFWTLNSKSQDGAIAYLEEETNNLPFVAGKPFIIQATAAQLEVVYEGAATGEASTNGALHGTLVYMDAAALAAAGEDIYMLFNNELRPVGVNNHLDANRAYVRLNELHAVAEAPQSAPGRRVRAMPMQPQVATGFEAAEANEAPRKVLINGELFIIRGEKMYDAKGQLVK